MYNSDHLRTELVVKQKQACSGIRNGFADWKREVAKMIKKIAVCSAFVPMFLSCQEPGVPVVRMEETSRTINGELEWRVGAYFTSGQYEQNGFGVLDLNSGYFCFQRKMGDALDSLPIPENRNTNFYNVVPNPAGTYYFLDPNLGLYFLTKGKPVFLDSINDNPLLRENGLMISNAISNFEFAVFADQNRIVIPICWNYMHPQGKYKNFNKPAPRYCVYDVKTKELRLLHCMTPKESFKEDYANRERMYFTAVHGDTIVMSMPHKSEVVLYSIAQDKEIGRIDCRSTFQSEPIAQFGLTGKKRGHLKLDRYEIETPFYGSMFYNKDRNEYYRIFYHGLPERNEKGEYTIYMDKKSSILVLDGNLKLKKEILMEKNAYILFGITSTKKGFIINAYRQKVNDEYVNFEIIL